MAEAASTWSSRSAPVAALTAPGLVQTRALDPYERILSLRHANVAPHVLCQLALQQRRERSESDGLAGLLRFGRHGTHHGVDAAAAHAFSGLQAQHREAAS